MSEGLQWKFETVQGLKNNFPLFIFSDLKIIKFGHLLF